MDYKITKKQATQVMGIGLRTTNENWQSARDIAPHWGRFYSQEIQKQIPHQKTGEVIGLYCDYEKDHTKPYTFVIGCEVTAIGAVPEGLIVKDIPSSKYAVFKIRGKYPHKLMEAWQWVWEGHLNRTYSGDFEVYPTDFHPEANPDLTLYIAIE